MKTREELLAEENKNSSEFYPVMEKNNKVSAEFDLNVEASEAAHKAWVDAVEKVEADQEKNPIYLVGKELEVILTKRELAFLVSTVTIKLYKTRALASISTTLSMLHGK